MSKHVCYMSLIDSNDPRPIDYESYIECVDKPHMTYVDGCFQLTNGQGRERIPSSITQWRDREASHGQA